MVLGMLDNLGSGIKGHKLISLLVATVTGNIASATTTTVLRTTAAAYLFYHK